MRNVIYFPRERLLQTSIDRYFNVARRQRKYIEDFFNKFSEYTDVPLIQVRGAIEYLIQRKKGELTLDELEIELGVHQIEISFGRLEAVNAFEKVLVGQIECEEVFRYFEMEFEQFFQMPLSQINPSWINIRIDNDIRIVVDDLKKAVSN